LLLNTRKKIQPEVVPTLLGLFVLLCITFACNTRQEGCLNPDASNFDLDAERACDACCTFPTLTCTLSQKWDGDNFIPTDTFFDKNLKPYFIVDIQYFLSAWSWKSLENETYTVDSTVADCAGQVFTYTNDINIVDPRRFVYTLGTFRIAPIIDTLSFHMGLVEDFSCLNDTLDETPVILTASSPLWNPATGALSTMRLILNRNPVDTLQDTIFIDLHHRFSIPYSYTFKRGVNYSFLLSVNYALWFENADVDDLSSFTTAVIQGLEGSITKTQ